MRLYLHRVMSYVKVLVCSLLRSMLGVLGHGAGALLGRLQHHQLGLTVASRVVGAGHGSLYVGLCNLSQRVGGGDPLVTVDAVALDGVRPLWRCVARGHVGWGGCRQGTRMVQGLGLRARLGVLSGTGGGMLRRGLVARRGAGWLRLMNRPRVVRERLRSVDALLRPLGSFSLRLKLGASRRTEGLWMGASALTYHPGSALEHRVHGLSWVRSHGLYDLLLAVLLVAVL